MQSITSIYSEYIMKPSSTTPKKTPNTTVAIDAETTLRLNSFCQRLNITKKDFIMLALDFFEQTGLTPSDIDKVISSRSIEKQMEMMSNRLNAIDQRTEQSNTIISNVQGMVMGQVGSSIKDMLEAMIIEREAANQLLLEVHQERQKNEELQQITTTKKKRWWRKNKD